MQIIGNLEDKQISFCLNISLGSGVIRLFCISVCIHSGRERASALLLEQEAVMARGCFWDGFCIQGKLREHIAALSSELFFWMEEQRAACSDGSANKQESEELALNSGPGRARQIETSSSAPRVKYLLLKY